MIDLARALGNRWSAESISNYELDRRDPLPEFIAAVARALRLSREQQATLIRAHLADRNTRFLQEYLAVARVHDAPSTEQPEKDA